MAKESSVWVDVPNESLKVGDVVDVLGTKTITRVRPYVGPHTDFIFAVADTEPGVGFSLETGGYTRRLRARPLTEAEEAAALDEQISYDAEAAAYADDDQRAYERSHAHGARSL